MDPRDAAHLTVHTAGMMDAGCVEQTTVIGQLLKGCMDGWLGFYGILSMQITAVSCLEYSTVY